MSPSDVFLDESFVVNGITKMFVLDLSECNTTGICNTAKVYLAFPCRVGTRESTFSWAAETMNERLNTMVVADRVHVPDALGSVIPEIDSMREDFPEL